MWKNLIDSAFNFLWASWRRDFCQQLNIVPLKKFGGFWVYICCDSVSCLEANRGRFEFSFDLCLYLVEVRQPCSQGDCQVRLAS